MILIRAAWLRLVALFFLVAALALPTAEAQGEAPLLTLKQSIEMALQRNLDIRVAREEIEAALERQNEARTGFLPTLRGKYTSRRLSEVPYAVFDGRKIDFADQDQYRFTGTIEQPLFTGFATISNYHLARLGLDVAKIQLVRARLDLILDVKEAYFGILSAEKIHEVSEQSVHQLQAQLDVAENFYRVGMSPRVEVLEAKVRLAEARQKLIRAANDMRLAKARFNTILRRPLDQEVAVADILSEQPYEKPYESCLEVSLQKRPELMEAEKNVARAEKEIDLVKSAYYPRVTISGNYYRAGDDPAVNGSDFEDRENWDVMAEATMTFFEWGKTRYAANEKRTRLRQARETLEQIKDAVRLEVMTTYLNLQAAERNIWVAKKSVESATENFRISKERYQEQVATATEVLDAQTRLTQAKTNYTNSLVEFNVAVARLIRAMGLEDEPALDE
jgi:outer membrane protein